MSGIKILSALSDLAASVPKMKVAANESTIANSMRTTLRRP